MERSFHKLRMPDNLVVLVREMHPQVERKIKASLKIILLDPYSGKELKDELAGLRSFRSGRLRIVYRIAKGNHIDIISIGPRKHIYLETLKIIRREKENV